MKRPQLRRMLASPRFAQGIMLAWLALLVAWLVPLQFQTSAPQKMRVIAYGAWPFMAVYTALVVSIVACTIHRLRVLRRRLSTQAREFRKVAGTATPLSGPFQPGRAARTLRRAGFRRVALSEDQVWAVRFPLSPLGTLVLHLGFLALIAAGTLALLPGTSFIARARVTEGATFDAKASEFFERGYLPAPGLPSAGPTFTVDSVDALAKGELPAERLRAALRTADDGKVSLSASQPWLVDPITTVALEDFGVTPRLSLVPSGTTAPAVVVSVPMPRSFSGTERSVETTVSGKRYRLGVTVVSNAEQTPAEHPVVRVTLARQVGDEGEWRLVAQPATLPAGAAGATLGPVKVRLEDVRTNAVLRVTRSPSMPLVALGLLAVTLGASLRLVLPRTEAVIAEDPDGAVFKISVDGHRSARSWNERLTKAWEEARA